MTDYMSRTRALYDLHREEKEHEDRTRRMLGDLDNTHEHMRESKLRLIEKLLDVQVKEEISRQMQAQQAGVAELNAEVVRANSRRLLEDDIKLHIDEARKAYSGSFLSHLETLSQEPDEATRKEINELADKYIDPYIEAIRREKRKAPPVQLRSVALATAEVREKKTAQHDENIALRARKDSGERTQRVQEAFKMFQRDIGDLSGLLHVSPSEYNTEIGKKEAQLNDLRLQLTRQRAEEESLLHERQLKTSIIEAEQARLLRDVDAVCQKLVMMQKDLQAKEADLQEIHLQKTGGEGNSSWAFNTTQLEKDVATATQQEATLRQEVDDSRRTLEELRSEETALDRELASSVIELADNEGKYQVVLRQLEDRLQTRQKELYKLRKDEIETTRKVNDYLYRIQNRKEDVWRRKRELRSVIATVTSQLAMEDRVQSSLMARALELQATADRARDEAEHHVSALNNQLTQVNTDVKNKSTQVALLAEHLTNYYSGAERVKDVKMTAAQFQARIDTLIKEWGRLEWEAATGVAQVSSRIELNARETDRVLGQMAKLVVVQESLAAEGIDIANVPTVELERTRDKMYTAVTSRMYRESKYLHTIRTLRDRLQARARGDKSIKPLTRNQHISLEERRVKRATNAKSRAVGDSSLAHLKKYRDLGAGGMLAQAEGGTPGAQSITAASAARSSGLRSDASDASSTAAGGATGETSQSQYASHPDFKVFREKTIRFIKDELQPLYDTNQVTKKRFVDVVARVSSWFLSTHRPSQDLSESNIQELVRRIQEVLLWQDDERARARAGL